MKFIVTGADRPLGGLLCRDLGREYEIVGVGLAAASSEDLGEWAYQCVDAAINLTAVRPHPVLAFRVKVQDGQSQTTSGLGGPRYL